jgi:hypothetical protein
LGLKIRKLTNYKNKKKNYQLENILDRIWNAFKLNKATAQPGKHIAPLKKKKESSINIVVSYINKDICIYKICLNERSHNELPVLSATNYCWKI